VDSSVAGLGGCPYAAGASGNVATEDVLYMVKDLGIQTGVDMSSIVETAAWVTRLLGRQPASRVSNALLRKQKQQESSSDATEPFIPQAEKQACVFDHLPDCQHKDRPTL